MTDDRITDIFQQYGQFVTGRERAFIRAVAEAVAPQRTWVGLTQQDIDIAFDDTQEGGGFNEFARAIEAKLREKNERREKNT